MDSTDKRLRIGLLTTLGTNIGDDFIREGLMHVLRQLAPDRQLIWVAVNKHAPHTVYPDWHPIRFFYTSELRPRKGLGPLRRLAEHTLPVLGLSRLDDCDLVLQCGTPVIWEGCRGSEWADYVWRKVLTRLARTGTPVLNLGAGSSYPWERQPATLVGNPDESFARLMLESARVTTVRDKLARDLFASLGSSVRRLCCPAILIGATHCKPAEPSRKVLINYMRGGGHYNYAQNIDAQAWEDTMRRLVSDLILQGWQPLALAHNQAEFELAAKIWPAMPRICPETPQEYFEVIRDAAFGIFNRMHASVAAAGVGVPSVAVGTDTRTLMVETLGLPVFYVKQATVAVMSEALANLVAIRETEARRLMNLREQTLSDYMEIMRPSVQTTGRSAIAFR